MGKFLSIETEEWLLEEGYADKHIEEIMDYFDAMYEG